MTDFKSNDIQLVKKGMQKDWKIVSKGSKVGIKNFKENSHKIWGWIKKGYNKVRKESTEGRDEENKTELLKENDNKSAIIKIQDNDE